LIFSKLKVSLSDHATRANFLTGCKTPVKPVFVEKKIPLWLEAVENAVGADWLTMATAVIAKVIKNLLIAKIPT
jgi:hypothetical protein